MFTLNRPLLVVRGIVESAIGTGCVLRRRDGVLVPCSLPARTLPVQRGEEISVILIARARANPVVGLVNHTAIDGENYVRLTARRRPDAWDGILVSAAFVGAISALGVDGLLPFGLMASLYELLAGLFPWWCRERFAQRVDRLLDVEARRREVDERTGVAAPRSSSFDGEQP
ncbi:hypothetical protein [Sphaerotilus sp.]|uniref:hypothetical protein n=1 Tax=Sphaerotilus sp. TaxID=2093942 RepID=UPI002ACD4882|nr:hypothetical protein [Sphaerotilus sp.]MDZ7855741.1 hypothetical protein [Sphaerotilus sp.]